MSLGYNPEIKTGKLYLEVIPYYAPIKNEASALQVKYERLELLKKTDNRAYLAALAPIRAQLHNSGGSGIRLRVLTSCISLTLKQYGKLTAPPRRRRACDIRILF